MTSVKPESAHVGPFLAVDMGGSKLMLGLVQADGSARAVHRVEPVPEFGESLLGVISAYVGSLAGEGLELPQSCGVAVPGLTDPVHGLWRHGSFSGIKDWPIRDELESCLGMPVFIANDVDACAVGERLWGGAAHEPNYLWITLSNGVGGAVVLDGHLYRGPGFAAGEIGHMKAIRDGIPCECGGHGCLEQYASGRAISRHYKEFVGEADVELLSAESIAGRARAGEREAQAAFSTAAAHLGDVLADAVMLLNIPCIFLGGGVSQAFDLMEKPLQDALERNLYPEANTLPRIQVTRLGYEAALLGAAAVAHPDARESFL
ncbi:MAG: ROK family protein [Puniceicoccaceae bacterium]